MAPCRIGFILRYLCVFYTISVYVLYRELSLTAAAAAAANGFRVYLLLKATIITTTSRSYISPVSATIPAWQSQRLLVINPLEWKAIIVPHLICKVT